ncbi:MAG TPA: hypothetical protein VKP11_04145, partial [Frankiaceae bacterium]|nr:hypothetical protein [Frankiaceae bacterium]
MRRCAVGGLGAGAGLALLLVGPHPDDLPAGAGDLGRWIATDPEHALVTAVGLVAWVCLLWLCAGGALAALSALPGTVGRLAGRLARLLLPRLARRLVEVAVGV